MCCVCVNSVQVHAPGTARLRLRRVPMPTDPLKIVRYVQARAVRSLALLRRRCVGAGAALGVGRLPDRERPACGAGAAACDPSI